MVVERPVRMAGDGGFVFQQVIDNVLAVFGEFPMMEFIVFDKYFNVFQNDRRHVVGLKILVITLSETDAQGANVFQVVGTVDNFTVKPQGNGILLFSESEGYMVPLFDTQIVGHSVVLIGNDEKGVEAVVDDKIEILLTIGDNPENITEFDGFVSQKDVEIEGQIVLQAIRLGVIQ
jgi:hypothetical protein